MPVPGRLPRVVPESPPFIGKLVPPGVSKQIGIDS
jgi:hypothetical protein